MGRAEAHPARPSPALGGPREEHPTFSPASRWSFLKLSPRGAEVPGDLLSEQAEKGRDIWRGRGAPRSAGPRLPPFIGAFLFHVCLRAGGVVAVSSSAWFRGEPDACGTATCAGPRTARLLQHPRDALSVQRALARRQQELQTRTLLPRVASRTGAGGSGRSQETPVGMNVQVPCENTCDPGWTGALVGYGQRAGGAATCWGAKEVPRRMGQAWPGEEPGPSAAGGTLRWKEAWGLGLLREASPLGDSKQQGPPWSGSPSLPAITRRTVWLWGGRPQLEGLLC